MIFELEILNSYGDIANYLFRLIFRWLEHVWIENPKIPEIQPKYAYPVSFWYLPVRLGSPLLKNDYQNSYFS